MLLKHLALLGLVLLPGCTAPVVKRAVEFSAAAAPALTETREAYARVQSVHGDTVLAQRIDVFDSTSILKTPPPAGFGSAADLQVRADVLNLLGSYVSTLAEVSGEKPGAALDAGSSAAAGALGKLATASLPLIAASSTASVSDSETSSAAKAIDTLSHIAMERKRGRALPGILAQADGPVQTLCALLAKDFGSPGIGGLRDLVQVDYRNRLAHEDAAIRDHKDGYSYPEKRAAITALYALQARETTDDAMLAEAQAALAGFARAHHALAATAKSKETESFRQQLGELVVARQQLAALQKVPAKGESQ